MAAVADETAEVKVFTPIRSMGRWMVGTSSDARERQSTHPTTPERSAAIKAVQ